MNPLRSVSNPFTGTLGVARQVSRLFFPREYNLGGVDLDTVIEEQHNSESSVTHYPVETGAVMSDHITIEPQRIRIKGLLSDINSNEFIDFGITGQAKEMFARGRNTRSSALWQQLKKVQSQRTLLLITTNIQSYPSMVITSLSTSQDKDTAGAVFFDAVLEEIVQINIAQHDAVYEVEEPASETAKENAPTAKRMSNKIDSGVKKPVTLPNDLSERFKSVLSEGVQ